ncbi:MAG TPA: VOC family protein [Terriglobales bacterium]|nr:VOC family protein [Terriglobales bacterium]
MSRSFSASPSPKLSFDAVFYYVTDMEKSISFYRDGLGIAMISRDYVARFELDGVMIELVPRPPGLTVAGNQNARLCFSVANLEETLEQLRERGIDTGEIALKPGGRIAFFHDPDGNELSLWQYDAKGAREIVHSAELHEVRR